MEVERNVPVKRKATVTKRRILCIVFCYSPAEGRKQWKLLSPKRGVESFAIKNKQKKQLA